jgi:xanthine dehydrogenase YagR molybdenum-binding subunit
MAGDAPRSDPLDPVKIRVGMPSDPKEISVEIPEGDPFPWQLGDKHAVVGKPQPRLDAVAKVTGRAKYTHDINLPGMLFAKFVRCPFARATVKAVDVGAALKVEGVKVARQYGRPEVRYAWQHVAVVAATTRQAAEHAAHLVKVDYEVLPHAARVEQSLAAGAPKVVANKDNKSPGRGGSEPAKRAAVDDALKRASHVVEAVATTQVQTHSCLETHGVVAHWEAPEKLKVWASTQGTFSVRNELADTFQIPESNVTVITHYMGGGFGSKFGAGYFGRAAAELAKETGLPVKLMLDRKEEHATGGNRPDSIQDMKLGVSEKGELLGYRVTVQGTGGLQGGGDARNPLIYDFKEVDKTVFDVATNAGAAAAFRAPGHPQGSFAVETIIDLAAEALGMDPLELRMKNDRHPIRQHQYKEGAKLFGWDKRKKNGSDPGPVKRGMGVASAVWFQLGGRGADVIVRIRKDGSVEVRNGAQDIGTGTRTIMAMVTAEELGIPVSSITSFLGDTNDPIGPGSGGSTTAPTVMPAVRQAAYQAGRQLRHRVAETWGKKADDLVLSGGAVREKASGGQSMAWAEACRLIEGDEISALGKRPANYGSRQNPGAYQATTGGVQFAEVEVDTETGLVAVKRFLALQDCGTIMNPLLAESQVNGAVIQGISYALFEERHLDRQKGQMINADFESYKIAGTRDLPEIKVVLTEVVNGANNVGLAGLGEGPAVPPAAAIANAVHNAIGVRVLSLPMTPDRVLKALERGRAGK